MEQITRSLCRAGADRKSLIVAVGGGVVGDVAGFAAAAYLRGVKLVHIPTTVVAQVDSSIGGKTGVNLPEGKNLVGAFYPPQLVLTDPELLRTLSDREFRGGLAEVIKHAIIADAEMFAMLEKDMEKILRRDRQALGLLIPRNVQIKARVVSRDERESGLREILNYGHTFAHALESDPRRAMADGRSQRAPVHHPAPRSCGSSIHRKRHVERHAKRHATLRFGVSVDLRREFCQEAMSRRRALSRRDARLQDRVTRAVAHRAR